MKKAVQNGAKLIVADPRRIQLVDNSCLWLSQRPGSDIALINAICHVIVRDNLADADFIAAHAEGFEEFKESLTDCTPEWAENISGVAAEDIEEATHLLAQASMGPEFVFEIVEATKDKCVGKTTQCPQEARQRAAPSGQLAAQIAQARHPAQQPGRPGQDAAVLPGDVGLVDADKNALLVLPHIGKAFQVHRHRQLAAPDRLDALVGSGR